MPLPGRDRVVMTCVSFDSRYDLVEVADPISAAQRRASFGRVGRRSGLVLRLSSRRNERRHPLLLALCPSSVMLKPPLRDSRPGPKTVTSTSARITSSALKHHCAIA
jgi:hypothetical protein